jgi:hypothetical protein
LVSHLYIVMKQFLFFISIALVIANDIQAQIALPADSIATGKVTVYKDGRLEELVRKEAAFNETNAVLATRSSKGYRLMVLSTNDRPLAMKVRTQLLQHFPEQKVYMSFQPPYIKLKFGNFEDKDEAERYKKDILRYKLVSTNIYTVPQRIEIKPDKNKDKEKENK